MRTAIATADADKSRIMCPVTVANTAVDKLFHTGVQGSVIK
jgi:hypothetical protein